MSSVTLDGQSLTIEQLVDVAL
ncbi:MAG: hypothetical protein QOJ98_2485, partial [Acidobacteriota bacterium]|nr:hypothetical protein [Acidobacteriota bacterium]